MLDNSRYSRYLVTAALPYANGPLHIGHLAGAYLPSDIYVRYLRLKKKKVLFICGSDEYGAAITLKSKKEHIDPQKIVDKYHSINKSTFENLGISFDIYYRTSEELHRTTSQEFFKNLHSKNSFIEKEIEQYYDSEHNQFLADRYIMGVCPRCDYTKAYGDQCESCGAHLSSQELKDPLSILSGKNLSLKDKALVSPYGKTSRMDTKMDRRRITR